jgi:uncharacterized protein YgiM (DUF1202 family)
VVAPTTTNVTEVAPAPAIAPSTKARTAARKTPMAELRTDPLVPGSAVVIARRVNVRGRAGLVGEVIGRLTNGEPVTVIEEVTLKNSKANEPSAWAKIILPANVHTWVHSSYIDRANGTVKATKLNLRGGPGENFSVLGTLQKGDAVKEIESKGDWTRIEAPANAYAFVAAQYLKQEAPGIVADTTTLPPPDTTATVAENPVVAPTTEAPMDTAGLTNDVASAGTNEMIMAPEDPVLEPAPPRVVLREGIVRTTLSIQAPTHFELVSPDNFRRINYLYTISTNLDLARYKGMHIIVTGEEGLDDRWRNSPIITIQRIQVIE